MGDNPNAIEDEYIENLQQQIHFMELELKLLKEKQDEEEKSGGAGGLFLDEKTAGQHLTLLKEKYQKMHKELEKNISDLTQHRNELQGVSSTLNQKLANLTQQFRQLDDEKNESNTQDSQLLERLESEWKKKSYEKTQLEQELDRVQKELENEKARNTDLKRQNQVKELEDKTYQDNIRERIAHQDKLIAKLRANLDSINEEMVTFYSLFLETKAREY